jgi:hypothetical protein
MTEIRSSYASGDHFLVIFTEDIRRLMNKKGKQTVNKDRKEDHMTLTFNRFRMLLLEIEDYPVCKL